MTQNNPINSIPATSATDVNQLTYEQARAELVQVITKMESGNLPLEQTLQVWERGEALANRCQQVLDQAKERIAQARPVQQSSPTGEAR